jgi:hypothetical protein
MAKHTLMDANLVRDIDSKASKLIEEPEYYIRREHRVKATLHKENKQFSWWIEHPDVRRGMLKVKGDERGKLIKRAREGISNLNDAWQYLCNQQTFLTPQVLHEVARIADPVENKSGYRTARVSLSMESYTPPNALKVSEYVDEAFLESQGMHFMYHPVERASMLHLRLAGTQPFNSANKRVARLFQDKLLYDAHLPPAAIPAGERDIYLDLLEEGLVSLRDGKREGIKLFCDYIGGKVNSALDSIMGDLKL